MTKRERISKALLIVEAADPDGYPEAYHDVFSIADRGIILTDEQREALHALGFKEDEDNGWFIYT